MDTTTMINNIQKLLGFPSVSLELSEDQLVTCINTAIMQAKDHIQTRRYKSFMLTSSSTQALHGYTSVVDLSELDFDVVTNVYRGDIISPYLYDQFYLINYATRGVPESYACAINMRSNIEALVNRSWKVINKKLYLDKFYGAVTVEFIPNTIMLEDIDDSYWIGWIQRYAVAVAKEMLSQIRGKFVIDSNPFKTNADTLAQQAFDSQRQLMEEIAGRGLLDITR